MCLSPQCAWQIELTFKRWKSLCHFDRLPNHRDDTILAWLYAKLLLAVLLQRMALGVSELFPPEDDEEEVDSLVFDAVEGGQPPVANSRRRATAA